MSDALGDGTIPAPLRRLSGRYDVLTEIGRGGMSVVYRARELATGRDVAIKVVSHQHSQSAAALERFAREARTMATLRHPNIVETLAIEEVDGATLAIVNAFVPGETLRHTLRMSGVFSYERAALVLRDVCAALVHAHQHRIMHRDVKPENILLEASSGRALLTDFGIARSLDAETALTTVGASVGTPTYMSPEQVDGHAVDERTDVYSLGLVGWELLSGRRPWEGETLYAMLHKQKHEPLPSLTAFRPDIPPYLRAAIDGALAKDRSQRWQSAADFLDQLTPPPALQNEAVPAAASEPEAELTTRVVARAPQAELVPDVPEMSEVPDVPEAFYGSDGAFDVTPAPALEPYMSLPLDAPVHAAPPRRRRVAITAAGGVLALAAVAALLIGGPQAGPDARSTTREAAGDVNRDPPAVPAPPPATEPEAPREPAATAERATAERATPARETPRATAVPRGSDAAGGANVMREPYLSARCNSPALEDQRACLMTYVDRGDVHLTEVYQAMIAELRRRAGGAREPPTVQALRAEQRAWVGSRDEACRRQVRVPAGDPRWALYRVPCFAALSERRAVELSDRLARLRAMSS